MESLGALVPEDELIRYSDDIVEVSTKLPEELIEKINQHFYEDAVKYPESPFAIIEHYIEDNPNSYEKVGDLEKATHLFSGKWSKFVEVFGMNEFWEKINASFIQREIIDKG